jgi:hypothetical protein
MYANCGVNSQKDNGDKQKRWTQNTDCFQKHHYLYLDGRAISPKFLKTEHYRTGQFGIRTYIDISGLSKDLHQLKIVRKINETDSKEWTVPFYYSGN